LDAGTAVEWDAGDAIIYKFDVDVDNTNYSKVSFWIYSTHALNSGDLKFFLNDEANLTSLVDDTNVPALSAGTWTYVTLDIVTATGTNPYAGFRFPADKEIGAETAIYIDNLRLYNDSVVVDVAGNLASGGPVGTAFSFQIAGSTEGVGYYTGSATAGTVTIIPDTKISIGATATPLDIVVSTLALMASDTTATEVLSLSIDRGSQVAAGDFRWYDQAVSATAPITWICPIATTVSISAGY